ncbi:hypothetical protein KXL21_004750 [Salmonella enterica]|nr:hypothetical protein [Salmonella enterica subsp. enterica serovar Inganda]ECH8970927.1 hypothetical protein [Salmonella enterica subsp. enterica]EDU9603611.1 hypothetical protein [Salmonella enterica subsp. enterica]EHT6567957.1 hypothetical protein [Salmonella enterica]EIJ9585213.1 hypothetical protein [Salmonella enterica]
MQLAMKRKMRKLPFIGDWHMFRVLYSQDELERLEAEMKQMQSEYDRLTAEGEDVLEETRRANPRVTSELHIRELIRFRASRLKDQIDLKMLTLNDARNYVE